MYSYGRAKPKYPNINLSSTNIRSLLTEYVVKPVMAAENSHVVAFRLVWRGQEEELDMAWQNIIAHRETVDSIIKDMTGVSFFVSGISGTVSIHSRTDQPTDIYPALAYWVVGELPDFNESRLMAAMMKNGVGATVRQISQRRRPTEANFFSMSNHRAATLFMVVKDYGKGYVRDKIETLYNEGIDALPAVKFAISDINYMAALKDAQSRLIIYGFQMIFEQF